MSVTNSQLIRLLETRKRAEQAHRAKVKAYEAADAAEMEVREAIEGGGDKSIKRDLGPPWGVYTFVPNETIYSHVYDLDAFKAWAKRESREQEFIKEPEQNKKPLNQFVKRVLKTKGMEMPDGVEHRRTPYVTVTQAKSK